MTIKHSKDCFSDGKNKILSQLFLLIIDPYICFIKNKLNLTKKKNFKIPESKKIDEFGYCYLPSIEIETIDFIKFKLQEDRIFSFNEIDFERGSEFAKKNGFHDLAKDYFGKSKVNFTIVSWNTMPFEKEFGTTTWHQDRDGYDILKIFIYLDDTDINAGPHRFAVGSHKINNLRFLPLIRYQDQDVRKYYTSIIEYIGNKGTCFAENTRGLHRGTPPKKTKRSILQFEYYTGPIQWTKETFKLELK